LKEIGFQLLVRFLKKREKSFYKSKFKEEYTMTFIRWSQPARLSDIFDDIFTKSMEGIDKKNCDCIPAANIIENEDVFEIHIAAPGYSKEDVRIDLENNVLTVSCDKNKTNGQDINYIRHEFDYGTFRRAFTLPKIVDTEKIAADYTNGLLQIKLPKREESKARLSKQIAVS
jgi:HSP20 family protein